MSYIQSMKLSEYLKANGLSHAAFGRVVGVSQPIVSGWASGDLVSEKRAVQIERATEGAVTRKDLRPNDWAEIWPELAGTSATACVCATQSVAGQAGA